MGFAVCAILINFKAGMTEFETEIDNVHEEMENFLRSVARNLPTPSQPIYLKVQYKNGLKLIDKDKHAFPVQESFLSAFRDVYTDKAFKAVRLHNWEFELEFTGKSCIKISLISDSVVFMASKNLKKEISGCHFKVLIVENAVDLRKFSNELNGYLNRLGKRHMCSHSHNIATEVKSLMSFVEVKAKPAPTFNYKPFVRAGQDTFDPLSTLNTEGKKTLEKLRHFVSRQQIYDFIVEQEVSEEAVVELRKLTLGGK